MSIEKGTSIWSKETPSGGIEYRKSTKFLFATLMFLVPSLFYKLLIALEGLDRGPEMIVVLGYGILTLLTVAMLLVVIISIIDYLRRFE